MMNKTILAGMFARSNMGHEVAVSSVAYALKNPPQRVEDAAIMFCSDLIESDEHEEMFSDEACMWEEMLSSMDDAQITATWPHIAQVYAAAVSGQTAPCV